MNIFLVTIDPTGHFAEKHVPVRRLIDAAGLIPEILSHSKGDTFEAFVDSVIQTYGFGDYRSPSWGSVTPEGIYKSNHTEDPDLYPMFCFELADTGTKVYIYQYALVSFVNGEKQQITRMD